MNAYLETEYIRIRHDNWLRRYISTGEITFAQQFQGVEPETGVLTASEQSTDCRHREPKRDSAADGKRK